MDLSVIVVSYNTQKITLRCLLTLIKIISKNENVKAEVIVVDNGSTDGSVGMLKKISTKGRSNVILKLIFNKKNLGYPKANNQGLKIASGKYVLFLNSDTIVDELNFEKLLNYLEKNPKVGVLTVKVVLPDDSIDPASHRGFPTIWNAFCYFAGLEGLARNLPLVNRLFGGYHLVNLNLAGIHEIDSPSGAFYLSRQDILKEVGGFDESFFMYGEDLDLSFRIKKNGFKVIYYPFYRVTHLKHASGLEIKNAEIRRETRYHFFDAMNIFYKKHYERNHPKIINKVLYTFINFLKQFSMSS